MIKSRSCYQSLELSRKRFAFKEQYVSSISDIQEVINLHSILLIQCYRQYVEQLFNPQVVTIQLA
jgi:hypothetical protein